MPFSMVSCAYKTGVLQPLGEIYNSLSSLLDRRDSSDLVWAFFLLTSSEKLESGCLCSHLGYGSTDDRRGLGLENWKKMSLKFISTRRQAAET